MPNRTKEYRDKYEHALDTMYNLFKFGRDIEHDLEEKLTIARDELKRIKVITDNTAQHSKDNYCSEIQQLCGRGLKSTEIK